MSFMLDFFDNFLSHDNQGQIYKLPVIIFTNPSARAAYDTRSIFKWSLTGLNSEFSFSLIVASTRLKNLVCPTIYPWQEGE